MQTVVFGRELTAIAEKLRLVQLDKFLHPLFGASANTALSADAKNKFSELVFAAQAGFVSLSEEERTLAGKMGLSLLADGALLGRMIAAFQAANTRDIALQNRDLWHLHYLLQSVLGVTRFVESELLTPKLHARTAGESLLIIDIVDYDDAGVPTNRLADILQTLTALYEAIAQSRAQSASAPRITFVDSGSDIKIGLEGIAETIAAMSDAFARAWTAIRHRKNDDLERNFETALRGIEFLSGLDHAVSDGRLDAETARKLEIATKANLAHLITSGAMIEGAEAYQQFDRRAILTRARATKLLRDGSSAD